MSYIVCTYCVGDTCTHLVNNLQSMKIKTLVVKSTHLTDQGFFAIDIVAILLRLLIHTVLIPTELAMMYCFV